MQGSALAVLEKPLQMLAPRLELVLDKRVPVQRLIQTIMISVERLPKLLECDRQSLLNSAMTAAVLGLEVDGVTGQAYLIPFKGKAQLVVGYKGYNTIAARSGITITGEVVRDGDAFDFDLAEGWITHKPKLHGRGDVIGAWAKADAKDRPPIIKVMGRDELMAVKAKSPGGGRSDSPWNDPGIGFPAMCEKTVKRRLARSLPLNIMQYAARMDEAVEEQGAPTWISPERGAIVDGEIVEREPSPTPTAAQLIGREVAAAPEIDWPTYCDRWQTILDEATAPEQFVDLWDSAPHKAMRDRMRPTDEQINALLDRIDAWKPTARSADASRNGG